MLNTSNVPQRLQSGKTWLRAQLIPTPFSFQVVTGTKASRELFLTLAYSSAAKATPTCPDHPGSPKTTAPLPRPEDSTFPGRVRGSGGTESRLGNPPVPEALRACGELGSRTRGGHSGPRPGALRGRPRASTLVHSMPAGPAGSPQQLRPPPSGPRQ